MFGWQAIQKKPIPKPKDALLKEFLSMLNSDAPGIVIKAEWVGSTVDILVRDSWELLPKERKAFLLDATHSRWPAACRDFRVSETLSRIAIKDQSSKRVLASWSPLLEARVSERWSGP